MSKYGDLIKEARKTKSPDGQDDIPKNSGKRETKNSIILENKKVSIPEKKKTSFIESKETSDLKMPEITEEKLAGISIKVPENLRRHWVVESKRKGKSMTSVIIEALTKEFGSP
jgi:hypothetical protein